MNIERLLRMIFRMAGRKALNRGVDMAVNRGKSPQEMTPEERKRARAAKQTAKRARQTARMVRRLR